MNVSPQMRSLITRAYLRRIANSTKPIMIGPFRSELGFCVLYWLPFLAWAFKKYGIDPSQCCVVSRGGMGHLYPAKHSIDLYQLRSVDEVRLENLKDAEQSKLLKQMKPTKWDRRVLQDAATRIYGRGESYHVLHPSWMYWLFAPVWNEQAPLRHALKHMEFPPLPVPNLPDGVTLPQEFVAVKLYERYTFPLQGDVVNLVKGLIEGLSSRMPIVLLNQPICADDHADLPISGPNIQSLPAIAPEQNLLLQAAVLARCQAFVGTYGGVAQWALRYRKPSLSLYTHFAGTAYAHRQLSSMLANQMGIPFELLDMRAVRLWQAVIWPPTPKPVEQAQQEAVPA